jgi:hypothetical protein
LIGWRSRAAGLVGVETRRIRVVREFPDIAAFWATCRKGPLLAQTPPDRMDDLREALGATLGVAEGVPFEVTGSAVAARGMVPG